MKNNLKEIKEFAKSAINYEFCIIYLSRNLLKGFESKTDKQILELFEEVN